MYKKLKAMPEAQYQMFKASQPKKKAPRVIDLKPFYDFIARRERVIGDALAREWLSEHDYKL
jgi:hypothetical protein